MAKASFETPEGEDIEIDAESVISLTAGDEAETTLVELESGDEVTVVASPLEVASDLGLDPLEFIQGDADALEGLDDEDEFDEDD